MLTWVSSDGTWCNRLDTDAPRASQSPGRRDQGRVQGCVGGRNQSWWERALWYRHLWSPRTPTVPRASARQRLPRTRAIRAPPRRRRTGEICSSKRHILCLYWGKWYTGESVRYCRSMNFLMLEVLICFYNFVQFDFFSFILIFFDLHLKAIN